MPTTVSVHLTPSDKVALKRHLRTARSERVRDRIRALLMMATQLPLVQIAQGFTVTSATLINWKHRWLKRRHFGLADAPRSGRPSKADARYVKELLRVVRRDPRELRYAFTRWTAPRLAQYLGEETGVWLTPQWITELLRTHGIVWRKTKRTIRNLQKRAATERARKALQRLKKGL